MQALFDDVVEAQGGVDVVFANAGLASVPGFRVEGGQTFDTIERSDWDKVLGVNLNGVMHTMRSAARVMKRTAVRPHRRHRLERRAPGGADGVLRLPREQGGGDSPRPRRGARARPARRSS